MRPPRRVFITDDGTALPVSDAFLLPFLSPTSPGTRYWDPPPAGPVSERQQGRVLLQLHQALAWMQQLGIDLRGRRLLDIGTGNGMIPRLWLALSDLAMAVGSDPFLSGEHQTSWQEHDQDEAFADLCRLVIARSPEALRCECYQGLLGFEHFSLRPAPVPYRVQRGKPYRFACVGAHELERVGETFDLFYAKCIDHIADWDGIFASVARVAEPDAVFYIKHFSFFSYLGPHRYATTNIPWGHLLLSDVEYRRFAHEFHAEREAAMVDFYFHGLATPRTTVPGLVRIAAAHGFFPLVVVNEPLRNLAAFVGLTAEVDAFWERVRARWPELGADEMLSGRYHIVLRKLA